MAGGRKWRKWWWVVGGCKIEFGPGRVNRYVRLIRWLVFGMCIGSAGLGGRNARAIAPHYFETADRRALGSGLINPAASGRETAPALVFELGEIRLFGIEGLRADGFRFGLNRDRIGFFVSGSNVASPLGSERTGGLGGYVRTPGKVQAGWRVGGVLVEVPPYSRTGLVTLSGSVVSELSSSLVTGFEVDDVRLAGEPFPGADITVWTSIQPFRAAALILTVRLSRWGGTELGFAGSFYLGRACCGSVGYDNATKQIKTALSLSGRTVGCGLGAMFHPLLGVSKEIFLRWQH